MSNFVDFLERWQECKEKLTNIDASFVRVIGSSDIGEAQRSVNRQRYDLAIFLYDEARRSERELNSMSIIRRYFNRKELKKVEKIIFSLEERIRRYEEIETEQMEKTLINGGRQDE